MSTNLVNTLEANRQYISTGRIRGDLLRQVIYQAWERSHLFGANPRTLQADKLSGLATQRLIQEESDLIEAARPYLRILSQAAGGERHAVMLSDRNAIVLDVVGDEASVRGPESVPGPGALLSEGVAGANGVGTSLAENSYIEIIGPEHFIEGFHAFSCQGIPLRNEKRETVGALSISVRRAIVGQRLKEILLCASHGIEADLLQRRLEQDVRRVLTSAPHDYQPLEDLRQDIIQAYSASRLQLEAVSRLAARNQYEYALQLLQQAERSIQLFRHRAGLWQDLASLEVGTIQSVSLLDSVRQLVELLSTELAIRRVEVIIDCREQVQVQADPRSLSRQLVRNFFTIFERVGFGGAVQVEIQALLDAGVAKVRWIPISGSNRAISEATPLILILPLA